MYRVSLNDEQLLDAVDRGLFDWNGKIPTFRQFDELVRTQWAERNRRRMVDSYRTLTDYGLTRNWHRYVVSRFARGARLPRRVWWMLDDEIRQDVCETARGRAAGLTSSSTGKEVYGAPHPLPPLEGKHEASSGNPSADKCSVPSHTLKTAVSTP